MVDIAYVGSQGHRLKRETALNMPAAPGPGAVQSRRPWQYIGLVQNPASLGNSNYNALQAKIEKQMSGGIALLELVHFWQIDRQHQRSAARRGRERLWE